MFFHDSMNIHEGYSKRHVWGSNADKINQQYVYEATPNIFISYSSASFLFILTISFIAIYSPVIVPGDNNYTVLPISSACNYYPRGPFFSILQSINAHLRHSPQNISKPHFSAIKAPQENPLPGETSPCIAYQFKIEE